MVTESAHGFEEEPKFGKIPNPEDLVLSLKELTLEQLREVPFSVLNELLKTKFPAQSNGKSHKFLFEALQRTVTTEDMQSPLELILRGDGLMIRICGNEKADFYKEAMELAKRFHLTEDRISHSLCADCAQKERERAEAVIAKINKDVADLSIFNWDGDETEQEKK
jgi:hypothetical protein